VKTNKLLTILRKYGHDVPKDRRTLLHTPGSVDILDTCGGQYVYFGLQKCLHMAACCKPCCDELKFQINVDGIPLYSSSSMQLWPVLCSVNNSKPMMVAMFLGKAKPNCLETFLADFVSEMSELNKNGFMCLQCEGAANLPVVLHSVVCDAPARAFIKNIYGHKSLNGCERCKAVGMFFKIRIEQFLHQSHVFKLTSDAVNSLIM